MAFDYFNCFLYLHSLLIRDVISACFSSNCIICCNQLLPNNSKTQFVLFGNYLKNVFNLNFWYEKHTSGGYRVS